ncbi:hypothetical protein F0562_004783 [Nyssa sinensis]|uniref:Uncharacterized protein n=1 Tax=Nyssa sinensis TaxID=561372 RepID=A0A5J5AIL6_9ASTE|nr:hypothetical protein F0562_004783 [Nyssa sinensis]
MGGVGAFWGTRVMEIVKKHDSGGLVWKRIKLTTTRKANAKKRLLRVWQNEAGVEGMCRTTIVQKLQLLELWRKMVTASSLDEQMKRMRVTLMYPMVLSFL